MSETVSVSVMQEKVVLMGRPSGEGAIYYLYLPAVTRAVTSTEVPDPKPPTNSGLAAYFATARTKIDKALVALFGPAVAQQTLADLQKAIGALPKGE